MLKKILFAWLFGMFANFALSGQSAVVSYMTTYNLPQKMKNISLEGVKKMNAFSRPRAYYYDEGKSVYRWLKIKDTTIYVDGSPYKASQSRRPVFYKDFEKKEMLIVDVENDSLSAASIDMDSFLSWKIQRENKMILGHLCRKATLELNGKNIEAWFATDIDIMDGPEIYFGLPGLILEIRQGITVTKAVKIEFRKPSKRKMEMPFFDKKITYSEYLKRRKMFGRMTPK